MLKFKAGQGRLPLSKPLRLPRAWVETFSKRGCSQGQGTAENVARALFWGAMVSGPSHRQGLNGQEEIHQFGLHHPSFCQIFADLTPLENTTKVLIKARNHENSPKYTQLKELLSKIR
ncbi:MAG: hypothetical protein LBV61_04525 [Burkholderiaceae bacterium]|nr:hypothetical protein [Burkholderiaceae bacterium]